MTADEWSRVKEIFHGAIERSPGKRSDFVIESCGGNAALRAEVERLLAAHDQAGSFIEQSPVTGASPLPSQPDSGTRQTTMAGRVIGRYHVGRLLGAGGMGEVYAARDVELGREVALKIATGADADARTRLKREAQHASQLNHPHICTIHEVGSSDGQPYIVMEYVDGQRLSDLIDGSSAGAVANKPLGQAASGFGAARGLPVEMTLRYGIQIADALAHAHRNGVTHRDLKSANIVITPEGRAKVLDFGLARRMPASQISEVAHSEQSLTAEGLIAGTLPYMAPELLRGEAADARSDIWALGVVLYEMAAGLRPFTGATGFELSGAILHAPPAPLPGHIPRALQQIIRRCLAKDPRERYKQADEIRSALETAQASVVGDPVPDSAVPAPAVPAPRVPRVRRLLKSCRSRRAAWIGGVSLAIIVLINLPISTRVRNTRGYSLLEAGHPEDALREFEKNVKAAPGEANSHDSLGEAYLVMGKPDAAVESYNAALAINPTYSASRRGRAWAWGMLGRFDQAIADDPPDPYVKALLLSRVGRYEEAEEVLADEDGKASAFLLASMLATERGQYEDALDNVKSAEGVIADLGEERKRVYMVFADLLGGTAAARAGDLKAAQGRLAAQAKRYKAMDPTEKWWHQALAGEIALATADPQAALDAYAAGEPSRKMWPNLGDSMVIFANSLSLRDLPARAQAARGDLAGAIQTYRRLLTPGPDQKFAAVYEPRFVLEIARLLNRTGDNEAAKAEYQRFLDFWKNADPGLPEVAEARKVVDSR